MNKHYEQIVTARYLACRRYEVIASEVSVTVSKRGWGIRETVRSAKVVVTIPTLLSSFFAGESLLESYKRRIVKIDEEFKLYDFDKISINDISIALQEAAKKADRILPRLEVW